MKYNVISRNGKIVDVLTDSDLLKKFYMNDQIQKKINKKQKNFNTTIWLVCLSEFVLIQLLDKRVTELEEEISKKGE